MRKFNTIFLITILLGNLKANAKEYTYESLLTLARKNSISSEIAKTRVIELEAEIEKTQSDYFPKIRAVIGNERRDSRSEPEINKNNFVGELRVDYNLYRFGGTSDKIDSLRTLRNEEIKIADFTQKNLERSLKKEYFEALYYKHELSILEEELKFNKTLKKQVNLRKKQGLVGDADVLEIDMRDATLKDKILQIEEHYQHSLDSIRKLTFISHEEEIKLKGDIPHEHFDVKIDELVEAAYKKNLELSNTLSKVESINFELNSSKTKRLPEINLMGRYGKMRIDEQYTNNESLEGLVGVYVDIPLFDGGEKSSQTKILKSRLAREKLKATKSKKNLHIDVLHRFEKMQNIHKQVDLAEINVKNSKNYFNNVLKEYKRGVKNSLDLVSARDRLMNFKKDLIAAKRNFLVAKIDLEEVVGVSF